MNAQAKHREINKKVIIKKISLDVFQRISIITAIAIITSVTILVFVYDYYENQATDENKEYLPYLRSKATPEALKEYDSFKATCNFDEKPDGQCFVKAFESCEYASLKNDYSTIEGDPIFNYLEILPSCEILYIHDNSFDKFSSEADRGKTEFLCQEIKINNNESGIDLFCNDGKIELGFYLESVRP